MKTELILELANLVEAQPHTDRKASSGFSMVAMTHDCGTPACIAGWAAWEARGRPSAFKSDNCFMIGREYLDINTDQAFRLFMPRDWEENKHTPAQAARTLRHLARTGEVVWNLTAEGT